ncbi:Ff.00g070180.m01.CDS01 [Fusarium sp. VM40]|nr:Ff.00g070180.m01.CDS01 [Fusarium sp. VM40]
MWWLTQTGLSIWLLARGTRIYCIHTHTHIHTAEADGGRGFTTSGSRRSLPPTVRGAASWGSHDRVRDRIHVNAWASGNSVSRSRGGPEYVRDLTPGDTERFCRLV